MTPLEFAENIVLRMPLSENGRRWVVKGPREYGRDDHAVIEYEEVVSGEWFSVEVYPGYRPMTLHDDCHLGIVTHDCPGSE